MAWLDHDWDLQDSVEITTATTTNGTNVVNMGAAVSLGAGDDVYITIELGAYIGDTGDEKLDCRLYGAASEDMSTTKILVGSTGAVIPGDATASTMSFRPRAVTAKQWYRMEFVTTGTWAGSDTITIVGVHLGRTEQTSMRLPSA